LTASGAGWTGWRTWWIPSGDGLQWKRVPIVWRCCVFDLSLTKLLILAVIALIVFGPNELPKVASQVGRVLRDLRRIADGATAELKEGLGPEFQNFELDDLNPRRFVTKHLFDDETQKALFDEFKATSTVMTAAVTGAPGAANGANGTSTTLGAGEDPPFDVEAT
jgi:sec-independent protein translocase protein TatB